MAQSLVSIKVEHTLSLRADQQGSRTWGCSIKVETDLAKKGIIIAISRNTDVTCVRKPGGGTKYNAFKINTVCIISIPVVSLLAALCPILPFKRKYPVPKTFINIS